jgi:NAD(P)-dependent dehydrogenase (short-subunit alcohol dehydrogenase family)
MGKGHRDKVAVVSGAAEGLGQAFAVRLAEDGAHVALVDRKGADGTAKKIAAHKREALAVACDVSSETDVAALAKAVEQKFGRCDILVNAAGIYPPQPFAEMTFADWRRMLSINLDSMFLMTKAFAAGMRSRRWGRIVNIASDTVSQAMPNYVHYIASKMGVIGFTRAIASEFGPDGVTANVIAPGLTRTPGTLARGNWPGGRSAEEFFAFSGGLHPIPRVGTPDDMVGTLSYLTSDDAAYVTGQTIFVGGGLIRAGTRRPLRPQRKCSRPCHRDQQQPADDGEVFERDRRLATEVITGPADRVVDPIRGDDCKQQQDHGALAGEEAEQHH